MTNWLNNTKPTRANVRHRLQAAIDALDGAEHLRKVGDHDKRVGVKIRNARAWAESALDKMKR